MSQRKLKFYYQNCRSIGPHLRSIKNATISGSSDVFLLTETWLNEFDPNSSFCGDNYQVVRRDRDSTSRGGGIMAIISSEIRYSVINVESDLELLAVKFLSRDYAIYCMLVYLPPPVTLQDIQLLRAEVRRLVATKMSPEDRLLLVGDFNLPELYNNPICRKSNLFRRLLAENGLQQYCNDTTRGLNRLDLVCSSVDLEVLGTLPFIRSDHSGLVFFVDYSTPTFQHSDDLRFSQHGFFRGTESHDWDTGILLPSPSSGYTGNFGGSPSLLYEEFVNRDPFTPVSASGGYWDSWAEVERLTADAIAFRREIDDAFRNISASFRQVCESFWV